MLDGAGPRELPRVPELMMQASLGMSGNISGGMALTSAWCMRGARNQEKHTPMHTFPSKCFNFSPSKLPSVRGQIVNILGFAGRTASVTTIQLYYCSSKPAIDDM